MGCPSDVTGPLVGYDSADHLRECIVVVHRHADGAVHYEGVVEHEHEAKEA